MWDSCFQNVNITEYNDWAGDFEARFVKQILSVDVITKFKAQQWNDLQDPDPNKSAA